jgi:hypothetical protein
MRQLKIPQTLYNKVVTDLERPHKFAFERVGFLFVKTGRIGTNIEQILAANYIPVADDNYIKDTKVGAKINSIAIRSVIQRILDTGEGAFHVHMHNEYGIPRFSSIDRKSLLTLIPSFQATKPNMTHGALLLSKDSSNALIWLPNEKNPVFITNITIVGYPLVLGRRC